MNNYFEVVEVHNGIAGAFIMELKDKEDQITFNPNGKFYCCYYGEKIVGVISTNETKKTMRIKNFFVKKEWRGKGVGTTLLNYAISTNVDKKEMTVFATKHSWKLFLKKKFEVQYTNKNNVKFMKREANLDFINVIVNKPKVNKESAFKSPVYGVKPVPIEKIKANAYNPNSVAAPEMELLYQSIKQDGYTMPVVCYYIKEKDIYEIVDGFHRYTIMKKHKDIYDREGGMLPVSVIDKPIEDRMASTIRHNRARGSHSIELMSNIVAELVESGMSDSWIAKNIGMDLDEILRLKQITGLAALFKDKEFSKSWE